MSENSKRHFSKVKEGYSTKYSNTFRKLSYSTYELLKSQFIKCPVNIGDWLKRESNKKAWKVFKLYVKFLDMKVQNPNCGIFQITHSHRAYQRVIKTLIEKGWVSREKRVVFLRAYQHVWRDMGISRVSMGKGKRKILKFKYWKIPISLFSENRKDYLKEIEDEIRKRISKRKRAQMRYALKEKEKDNTKATFSSKSAGSLFGYKSTSTGTKLRNKHFEVIEPKTPEEIQAAKPKWINERGRYEEPTKQIAL